MSKIARYQGNVRAFASDAQGMERTVFGGTNQADDLTSQITASFLRGWGIVGASEHPSLEDFNAAMYAMSQFIAYQHQMGIAEWHAEQEYHLGSICTHNGESYQSLQDANVGSPPPSAKWTPVLTSKNGLANLGLSKSRFAVVTSSQAITIPNWVTEIYVTASAGGGGGGGSGGSTNLTGTGAGGQGGGSGEFVVKRKFAVTPGSTINVTIGAEGTGGIAGTPSINGGNGTDGGGTVIGSLLTLNGGGGGHGGDSFMGSVLPGGGAGGTGHPAGQDGQDGANTILGNGCGGNGGNSFFGGGAGGSRAGSAGVDGKDAYGYGSGGGGAGGGYGGSGGGSNGGVGGKGSSGIVIIEW